ncbi:MAG: hypothetical protein O7A69_03075, partial [SAR324 cluster bacterium]|nr:hypothetical protein [SAR324 cluster bacterium]
PRHFTMMPAALLLAIPFLAACGTARERDTLQIIPGSLRFRNAETPAYFKDKFRNGNIYQDFRPLMDVDTIFEYMRYRVLIRADSKRGVSHTGI